MRSARRIATLLLAALTVAPAQGGEITAWVIDGHVEQPYFARLEAAFNAEASGVTVDLVPIPGYNEAIQVAALSGDLPDLIMLDGPNMAAMVWAGLLQPLDPLLDPAIIADLLPEVRDQGTYPPDGRFYLASPYDSSAALWGDRARLEAAGIAIPGSVAEAWTADELEAILAKLKDLPGVEWPLDLGLGAGRSEWLTYGVAPFVQSAGGELVDRSRWRAEGVMNAPANVAVLERLQAWVAAGYVVPATAGANTFYGSRTALLAWAGSWMRPLHAAGLGADLVLIPAPSFGPAGPVTPNGGWGWAVPASTTKTADVAAFLAFAFSADQVAGFAETTGYMPSRRSVLDGALRFAPGGADAILAEQARCCARVRPVHPAYPAITSAWAGAVADILSGGAEVQAELDAAAAAVDQDIADNAGYPPFGR